MSKVTFCVATTLNINLDGMTFPEEMPIFENYNMDQRPVSVGRLFRDGAKLMCEADIPDLYMICYPGVQIQGNAVEENGRTQILDGAVIGVSVFVSPNQDETILPICEQIKQQS